MGLENCSVRESFRLKAMLVEFLSYRVVNADFYFRTPEEPHVIRNPFTWKGYDKLDLGLDELVLIRVALENPRFMPEIFALLKDNDIELDDMVGTRPYLKKLLEKYNLLLSFECQNPRKLIDDQLGKTDRDLDNILTFLKDFPESYALHFMKTNDKPLKDFSRDILRTREDREMAYRTAIPAFTEMASKGEKKVRQASGQQFDKLTNLVNAEFSVWTTYFTNIKQMIVDWVRNMDKEDGCLLDVIALEVKPVTSQEQMAIAKRHTNPKQEEITRLSHRICRG